MKNKLYIGIDNGVSGTIGAIFNTETWFFKTPIKTEQNYTKKRGNISRVNVNELMDFFMHTTMNSEVEATMCLVERPMVNSTRFNASISAVRALEATLIALEAFAVPFQYEDSKSWQKELLPAGIKGSAELKEASKQIGIRLFPQHRELIEKHGDADGLLLAEYCRRKF